MASTTGPDLDGARVAVENLMDDSCIVRFDVQGRNDDQYDHSTGDRIRPNPQDAIVYDANSVGFGGRSLADEDATGGKCKIRVAAATSVPRESVEGGAQIPTEFYDLGLPWDAPVPRNGANVQIVTSRRDPTLVDQSFVVRGQARVGTMLVSRHVLVERRGAPG